MQMMKTIVIGAGVMGASVAYRLAQAGAAVTVLEATRIGGGTSGISFAWTNAHQKPPKPYHDLNVAGMKAHAALAAEIGVPLLDSMRVDHALAENHDITRLAIETRKDQMEKLEWVVK